MPRPANSLALKPHQVEAVRFALSRNRSYLRLDPGLGKTPVAATYAMARGGGVVYVTPPFLVENVRYEFERWAPELTVAVYCHGMKAADLDVHVLIVPDSLLTRHETILAIYRFTHRAYVPTTLIVDEAHRFKSLDAKRTKALFAGTPPKVGTCGTRSIVSFFDYQVYMSGTPMPNRPIELFPVLNAAAPETIGFRNYWSYGRHFCAGKQTQYGWDFSGASNMKDLRHGIVAPWGPFMLKMTKSLLKLPPKTEEVFVVSADLPEVVRGLDSSARAILGTVDEAIKHGLAARIGKEGHELHMPTYRRLLGAAKVPHAVQLVRSIMEETDEALIIFAHHVEVVNALYEELKGWGAVVISGETPTSKRNEIVKEFQKSLEQRIIIGNYHAMGVGFTLTKATRVLFVEFDWCPGVNDQAGDRAHRIGQTKPVHVQYLVYKNSLDKAVIETLLKKRSTLSYV